MSTLPVFPYISKPPSKSGYSMKPLDDTVKATSDGGYDFSRPRNTNFNRYDWNVPYNLIPQSDVLSLRAFFCTVANCAGLFVWVDPIDGLTYTARFQDMSDFAYAGYDTDHVWNIALKIRSQNVLGTIYTGYVPVTGVQNGVNKILTLGQPVYPQNIAFVFVNGILQTSGFTISSAFTLTFTAAPLATDSIQVFTTAYDYTSLATSLGVVSAVGTVVTFSQSLAGLNVLFMLNGVLLSPTSYTVSGSTITLTAGLAISDVVSAVSLNGTVATVLSTVRTGLSGNYRWLVTLSTAPVGNVLLFVNGILQSGYTLAGSVLTCTSEIDVTDTVTVMVL